MEAQFFYFEKCNFRNYDFHNFTTSVHGWNEPAAP